VLGEGCRLDIKKTGKRKIPVSYRGANIRIVDEQLAKAGMRLAKLINEVLRKK